MSLPITKLPCHLDQWTSSLLRHEAHSISSHVVVPYGIDLCVIRLPFWSKPCPFSMASILPHLCVHVLHLFASSVESYKDILLSLSLMNLWEITTLKDRNRRKLCAMFMEFWKNTNQDSYERGRIHYDKASIVPWIGQAYNHQTSQHMRTHFRWEGEFKVLKNNYASWRS